MNIIEDIEQSLATFKDTHTQEPAFLILSPVAYEELRKVTAKNIQELVERRNREQNAYIYTANPDVQVGVVKGLKVAVTTFESSKEYELYII